MSRHERDEKTSFLHNLISRMGKKTWACLYTLLGGLVILCLVIVITTHTSGPQPAPAEPGNPKVLADKPAETAALQTIIETAERGYLDFHKRIEAGIHHADPRIHQTLNLPRDLVQLNRANRLRNSRDLEKHVFSGQLLALDDFRHFYYDADQKILTRFAAAYSIALKRLFLSPHIDPTNTLDMLIFHHELQHVGQDNFFRSKRQSMAELDTYVNFFQSSVGSKDPNVKPRVIVIWESGAYACELECANIITDGWFRQKVVQNQPVEIEDLRQRLKARLDQITVVYLLIALAQVYWPNGFYGANGEGNAPFTKKVAEVCVLDGYEIYALMANGSLVKATPEDFK
jgi:hypothetical protein